MIAAHSRDAQRAKRTAGVADIAGNDIMPINQSRYPHWVGIHIDEGDVNGRLMAMLMEW